VLSNYLNSVIHILFLPGTFGSTVQFLLRTYCTKYKDIEFDDEVPYYSYGSMHGYAKTGHYCIYPQLEAFLEGRLDNHIKISTPVYPMIDATAKMVINKIKSSRPFDPVIFLYVSNIEYAEINMIARFYKMSQTDPVEAVRSMVDDYILGIHSWNEKYSHWTDMEVWELREWLSLFYPNWINEWIESIKFTPKNWLVISTEEVFNETEETFKKILEYTGAYNLHEFQSFCIEWRKKQQYLLDVYNQVKNIVFNSIHNIQYFWEPIGFIEEVIIQKQLRDNGYQLRCFNLNVFPTNSTELHNLLEKI